MKNIYCLSTPLPEDIARLVAYGDWNYALNLIDMRLKKEGIPQVLKERLQFEITRLCRLKNEYIYSFDDAVCLAQQKIKNFSSDELNRLKEEGYADWMFVDGEIMFHRRFLQNIVKTYPGIIERLIDQEAEDSAQKQNELLDRTIEEIMATGGKSYYIQIKAGVKLKKEAARTGEMVRVYIPVPAACQQVRNIEIIDVYPAAAFLSPEDYPQRTMLFEKKVCGEDEFTVEYCYENQVEYKQLDASVVSEIQPDFDKGELEPHMLFTPYLKKLAAEITGNEKNPLHKARAIYDFITTNIKYSYVREYTTIENISEYAAKNMKGDCGVQALLFITLCRIAGIPARWQSGLYVNPSFIGSHDWAQFYIEPYGWLFADLSFGGSAYRKGNLKRWNFYFGNIDPFRMPANAKFQYDFLPEKKFLRSDPYDNQRGEVEYLDGNVYYDGFESIMQVVEIHEI